MKPNNMKTIIYSVLCGLCFGLTAAGCGSSSSSAPPAATGDLWYIDQDGDGFGSTSSSQSAEEQPDGYVDNKLDCDDSDYDINPGVSEITTDGIDNNCNDEIDESPKVVIPDTGQVISYTDTFGEDSDYVINGPSYTKLGENGEDLPDTAASWTMVRDNVTGLIWEIKNGSDGLENPLNKHDIDNTYTWEEASSEFIQSLNDSSFGSFDDWRIPTIRELGYLFNCSGIYPRMDQNYFPLVSEKVMWSSTPSPESSSQAWGISSFYDLAQPQLKDITDEYPVLAVRGEKTPSEFKEYGTGIIEDKTTGLMWQMDTALGDDEIGMTFEEAIKYCADLELGGFKDWRLPNRNELLSLVQYDSDEDLYIDSLFSDDTLSSNYWTSTTYLYTAYVGEKYAWQLNFASANHAMAEKDKTSWVRAVRGGYNVTTQRWYLDSDGDGYGDPSVIKIIDATSDQPTGYVINNSDCDDKDSSISPVAIEIYNDGIDQNCSGRDMTTWYRDSDNDGFGSETTFIFAEEETEGYIYNESDVSNDRFDCNDDNFSVNPDMEEIADDGLDNDCNGKELVSWYLDSDGDGYGTGLRISVSEDEPDTGFPYASNDLDCDDSSASIHHGMIEIFGDGQDSNCNGEDNDESLLIVPDTGQTWSYTTVPGEDSDYLINPQSYTKLDAGGNELDTSASSWTAVHDDVTGLDWEVKTDDTKSLTYTCEQALAYVAGLNASNFASHNDWRLPMVTELAMLSNLDEASPSIDTAYFLNTQTARYWTSTDLGSDSSSLTIYFRYGQSELQDKTYPFYVRAVRGTIAEPFIINSDGTRTERVSGLTWANGVALGANWENSRYMWDEYDYAGYTDWRLPMQSDVESLLYILGKHPDLVMTDFFSTYLMADTLWTRTLSPSSTDEAVIVSLTAQTLSTSPLTETMNSMGVRGTKLSRFIDNGDGTVLDTKTGLMWLKENANAGVGMAYEDALTNCESLTTAGYTDWRLPNRNEMLSLLEGSLEDTAMYNDAFEDSGDVYWTSTSSAGLVDNAWQIDFTEGQISLTIGTYTNENLLRAVRGGNLE